MAALSASRLLRSTQGELTGTPRLSLPGTMLRSVVLHVHMQTGGFFFLEAGTPLAAGQDKASNLHRPT